MLNHAPGRPWSRRPWVRWLLLAGLLLAFGLRLFRLGADSLWYDETVSVYLAGQSLPALIAHTAGDIHPPGYYLLLHAWLGLAGHSDWAAAWLSLFFGLLLVALAYRLAARLFGPDVGLPAAALVAISPYNLWYSQEVRMYTLAAVLGLALLDVLLSLLGEGGKPLPLINSRHSERAQRAKNLYLAAYALLGALGLWVLYYFAFLLAAVNLMVGLWWLAARRRGEAGWRWLGRWALAQGAVLLLYAPWIPIAWRQATSPPVPPWRSFTGLGDLLLQTWSALSLGQSVDPTRAWPVLLLFGVLFGLGIFYRATSKGTKDTKDTKGTKEGESKTSFTLRVLRVFPFLRGYRPSFLLAGFVFGPVLLIYLASFVTPLFHVRYAFTYSTPFYVILAAGLAWLGRRWRPALGLALAIVVVFCATSIYAYHTDAHYAADDHRAAVRFLAGQWRPGDAILVDAGYAYTALLTYWDGDPIAWRGRLVGEGAGDGAGMESRPTEVVSEGWAGLGLGDPGGERGPVVMQAGTVDGDPSLGWGDPQSDFYAMSRADTAAALAQLFAAADRVWVYRIYDTVTDPQGFIRDWLEQHGVLFEDRVFTGESQLRVQGYLTGRDPLAGATPRPEARLNDGSLALLTGNVSSTVVPVGGALDLALVWRVDAPPAADALLFAGLFDAASGRWAQVDERPSGPLYPVSAWPVGSLVRTPLRLVVPPGTPPGPLRLVVGWYRFVDGQPVWLPWGGDAWQDLGTVDVVPPPDWGALPVPAGTHPVGVTMGTGVQLLGFDAPRLEARPGESLPLDLFWRALVDRPEMGAAVLQITDDAGTVLTEAASAPAGGRAPFAGLAAGQVVRDPRLVAVPDGLEPGVYTLALGRRRADGTWLPLRRGPFPLGSTYPLATLRVLPPLP